MIGTIELPPDVVEGTRERFRAGSVFARPCPHANAARASMRRRSVRRAAIAAAPIQLMRAVCKDAPEEPRYQLELGDFLSGGSDDEAGEAKSRCGRRSPTTERDVVDSRRRVRTTRPCIR